MNVRKEVVIVKPTYLSFDIECYSANHNSRLPDSESAGNFVFQIGCTSGRLGDDRSSRVKVLFSLGEPSNIEGVTVVQAANEKDLLLKFRKHMVEINPDVMIGYNTMKFDWNYMITRSEKLGIFMTFSMQSRIIGRRAEVKKSAWSSSAYGEQKFRYLDPFGRTNVDVLLEIERNYKLPKYTLDAVAEYFLKSHKDDVTPRQLFMIVDLTEKLLAKTKALDSGLLPKWQRVEIKEQVQTILQRRRCHGEVLELRKNLMAATTGKRFLELVRQGYGLTGKYCIQDTMLPVDLMDKLNLWTTMEETSNCMNVPMSYQHTRGQQVKVMAQLYRETLASNIFIPYRQRDEEFVAEKYQGAMVFDANPGDYDNVLCFDFESLYPSVIIFYNICYTTLLNDDDPTPDEECHVLSWGDHSGCLAKGTKVSLANNKFVPIEELNNNVGGEVYGWNPVANTPNPIYRYKQTNFFNQGLKECVRLTFQDSTVLECTPDHRILTSEGEWVEASKLVVGGSRVKVSTVAPGLLAVFHPKLIDRRDIGLRETYDLEVEQAHSFLANGVVVHNCTHDPQKRKKKAEEVMCKDHRYRFRKMVIQEDGTRLHEGLMPRLERNLLTERKVVKKEMAKAEAKYKMAAGLAEEDDRAFYKKMGWEEVLATKPNSLTAKQLEVLKITITVLNAKQLALKVSANSVAADTPVPCIINNVFTYKRIETLGKTGTWKDDGRGNQLAEPIDGLKVWSDVGFTDVKYVFRHRPVGGRPTDLLKRVLTDSGSVVVTDDHSLLNSDGEEVSTSDVKVGDRLMHRPVPREAVYASRERSSGPNHSSRGGVATSPTGYLDGDCELAWLYLRTGWAGLKSKLVTSAEGKLDVVYDDITPPPSRDVHLLNGTTVRSVTSVDATGDYVYDLETASHHFAAGVGHLIVHNSAYGAMGAQNGFAPLVAGAASVTAMGRFLIQAAVKYILEKNHGDEDGTGKAHLVYGDTDSSMMTFEGKSTEESFALGDTVSKQVSHYLKTKLLDIDEDFFVTVTPPKKGKLETFRIDKFPRDRMKELDAEQRIVVYRYDANPINLQFENLYKRYLLLSKKRYVAHAVNRLGKIIGVIKKGVVLSRRDNSQYLRDTYSVVVNAILERRSEQEVMYLLYDRIHKLFTRQIPDANLIIYMGVKTIQNYAKRITKKQGRTVVSTTFIDRDGDEITDVIGPLDPRLQYPNIPQVLLALKMLNRGDDVPPNTRLEFLYLEPTADSPPVRHQGEKAEDYTYYRENKNQLGAPDYLHYLEKQLAKPMSELITVKYPRQPVPYEKLPDAFARLTGELNELQKFNLQKVKKWTRDAETSRDPFGTPKARVGSKARVYNYSGVMAKVQYVLDSAAKKRANPKLPHEIDAGKHWELVKVCWTMKSRFIIDALHHQYGIRKRTAKRPTQSGEKLRVRTKVAPTGVIWVGSPADSKKFGRKRFDRAVLTDIREEINPNSISNKKTYWYDLQFSDGTTATMVPRSAFTTYYLKDGSLMKDMLLARGTYRSVVRELDYYFKPDVSKAIEIFELNEDDGDVSD
jgi:DNA polymerase elongation subunit (family B)